MVGYNFGPPAIDFSPLGQLGATYDRSVRRTREAEIAANRERALAGFGQNGDLAALGQTLLRAGDLEGGMSALRMAAANEGTPWQKQRAAAEDARQAEADAYRRRQEEKEQKRYDEQRHPVRKTVAGKDEFGDPTLREYWEHPDGSITWTDTGKTERAPAVGPQSGGPGDPNLPATGGTLAQLTTSGDPNTPVTDTGQPEYGYAIPGTGQRFPHGTVLPPKGDTATAVQAPQAPVVAPRAADVPAQGAQPQQAPVAAPAGQVAVAAPPAPESTAVQAAPLTATQINKGTEHIAPMTNAEMIAEARRLGIRPGEYRAGREAAIKKEMAAKAEGLNPGQTTDMKNKLAQARKTKEIIDEQLSVLAKDVEEYGSEYVPGTVKARMQTTYTNLLMQLKDMFALGALQAKDMDVIQGMLTDPTAAGYNPLEALYKQFTQRDVTAQQVETIKQIVNNGLHAAEGALGGDPSTVPRMASPRLEKPLDVGGSRELGGGVTIQRIK